MMFHSRAARATILATGSALALMTAALGDRAHAETNLDASYTMFLSSSQNIAPEALAKRLPTAPAQIDPIAD